MNPNSFEFFMFSSLLSMNTISFGKSFVFSNIIENISLSGFLNPISNERDVSSKFLNKPLFILTSL